MDCSELLKAHVAALFTQSAAGRLVRVNEPGGDLAPHFFLGRTEDGSLWWFRDDVSENTIRDLEALCATHHDGMDRDSPSEPWLRFEGVRERTAPIHKRWAGPAFVFPS